MRNLLTINRVMCFLFLFVFCTNVYSQNSLLTFQKYLDVVKTYHPIAKQANILLQKGDAALLNAKGGFDPKLLYYNNQKQFKGIEYYNLSNAGFKIPTWFGIDIKGGYEQNQGMFLNPEDLVPGSGLWYTGISVAIGQGLFIDERRAVLRQAQIYKNAVKAEQMILLNELLYEASKAYWDWFNAYNDKLVYENAYTFSKQRLDAVKTSALLGDRPFIDTVEANIQLLNIDLGRQQANLDFKNSSLKLSIFLWYNNNIPLELAEGTTPRALKDELPFRYINDSLLVSINQQIGNHPAIQLYQFKLNELTIEKRYKAEKLKPLLNVNYNPISQGSFNNFISSFNSNNYTFGVDFNMPLLLRKERGDLQMTKLKIQETELNISNKSNEIAVKVKTSINDWIALNNQILTFNENVSNYEKLLIAEKTMFDSGESSIFMINSRELGFINAQIKLIELITKNRKSQAYVIYSAGLFYNYANENAK